MRDFSSLRFVEIGAPWLKTIFPQQTLCFSNFHTRRIADPANGIHHISLDTLPKLYRALREPDVSLVVCRPGFYPPWHWQWIFREMFSRRALRGESPPARRSRSSDVAHANRCTDRGARL